VMDEQVLLYANVVHKVTSSELPQTETWNLKLVSGYFNR
jgi:hypothetical protein